MARIVFTFVTFVFAMTLGATLASADVGLGNGNAFAWFRDADGDGIPNGMDPDYEGAMARHGWNSKGFIDEDGDGINDNAMDSDGDGIPNGQDADYTRPADGTGMQQGKMTGAGNQSGTGTGECDETGPKGNGGSRR